MGCLFACYKKLLISKPKPRKKEGSVKTRHTAVESIQEIIQQTDNFAPKLQVDEGNFSDLYVCRIHPFGKVAVKRILNYNLSANVDKESRLLRRYNHENIIRFYQCLEIDDQLCLVLEYAVNGSLHRHLRNQNPQLDCWRRIQICLEAAQGIHYLHTAFIKSMIHGNIKTENILLDANYQAKISQFGQSRLADIPSQKDKDDSEILLSNLGFSRTPPEMIRGEISPRTDVYSFGSVILEIFSGQSYLSPYPGFQTLVEYYRACKERKAVFPRDPYARWPILIEGGLLYLASECLQERRSKRLHMKKVVSSLAWLNNQRSATHVKT